MEGEISLNLRIQKLIQIILSPKTQNDSKNSNNNNQIIKYIFIYSNIHHLFISQEENVWFLVLEFSFT